MRIAFCFSGQIRKGLEESFESFKQKFAVCMNDSHIFLHTWSDINKDMLAKAIDLYKPREIMLSQQPPEINQMEDKYREQRLHGPQDNISRMFYSMKMSNELKKVYESIYGKYDVVFRMRYDMIWEFDLIEYHLNLAQQEKVKVGKYQYKWVLATKKMVFVIMMMV